VRGGATWRGRKGGEKSYPAGRESLSRRGGKPDEICSLRKESEGAEERKSHSSLRRGERNLLSTVMS